MDDPIEVLVLQSSQVPPNQAELNQLCAELLRQRTVVAEFITRARVHCAQGSSASSYERDELDAALKDLMANALGSHLDDPDTYLNVTELIDEAAECADPLEGGEMEQELGAVFLGLNLSLSDPRTVWDGIEREMDDFASGEGVDALEVDPGRYVCTVEMSSSGKTLTEAPQRLIRLAALPRPVRMMLGIYRRDDLPVT